MDLAVRMKARPLKTSVSPEIHLFYTAENYEMEKLNQGLTFLKRVLFKFVNKFWKTKIEPVESSDSLVEYAFSRVSISIPSSHLLPTYQKDNKLYDRFLPYLANYLPAGGLVVDVGANVGDTLAAMYSSNPSLDFVCVEADDKYFAILEQNISRIHSNNANVSIVPIKALAGESVSNVVLEGKGGTKKAVFSQDGAATLNSRTLDSILDGGNTKSIVLIKSDVDGYDFDVIDSARRVICEHRPILFFECLFDNDYQKASYEKTICGLISLGYDHWVVFDNFGDVILRTGHLSDIVQLFDYVWRQNLKRSTRTIHYYDILATGTSYRNAVDQCINDYLESV